MFRQVQKYWSVEISSQYTLTGMILIAKLWNFLKINKLKGYKIFNRTIMNQLPYKCLANVSYLHPYETWVYFWIAWVDNRRNGMAFLALRKTYRCWFDELVAVHLYRKSTVNKWYTVLLITSWRLLWSPSFYLGGERGSNIFVTKRSQLYSFSSSWLRFLYIREYQFNPIVPNIKAKNGYLFGYAYFSSSP